MDNKTINKLIAKYVMDWDLDEDDSNICWAVDYEEIMFFDRDDDFASDEELQFSTNIMAAWQVVEKLSKEGRRVILESVGLGNNVWFCTIYNDPNYPKISAHREESTAPLAICLAALDAKGVKI